MLKLMGIQACLVICYKNKKVVDLVHKKLLGTATGTGQNLKHCSAIIFGYVMLRTRKILVINRYTKQKGISYNLNF
jgi:hypothetical protein